MATTPASDATRRALGSLGTQVGSHQAGQVFPAAWAGPGWGQGSGLGCRAWQQLCGLSQDAHTCADLPGAGASTVAAPSLLQLIVGSSCQVGDASRTFLECRGSPRRGKAGRQAPAGPTSLILNLSFPAVRSQAAPPEPQLSPL